MLLDLLPEILEQITAYCSTSDLKNVACTSSSSNTRLQRTLYHTVRVPNSVLRESKKSLSNVNKLNDKLKTFQQTRVLRMLGPGTPQCCFKTTSKLNKLVELNMACSTDTDDLDVGILCEGLHDLRVLNLSHTKITDRGIVFIQKLKLLEELYLTNCSISDVGLSHLCTLRHLNTLCLSNTLNISDVGLSRLSTLTSLRRLDVSFCGKITDIGVFRISNLPSIEELNLSFTAVSDAGVSRLCGLKTLRKLDVSYCGKVGDMGVGCLFQSGVKQLNIDGCGVSQKCRHEVDWHFVYLGKQSICVCGSPPAKFS